MDETSMGEPQSKRPWYSSTWALIAAGAAGVLGLILLVAGIVTFTNAAGVRDEAAALEAQAAAVAEEVDDAETAAGVAREAAAGLPDLVTQLDSQSYAVLTASEATVAARNALVDCVNAATDVGTLAACFQDRITAVETAIDAELTAVRTLDQSVADTRDALDSAEVE